MNIRLPHMRATLILCFLSLVACAAASDKDKGFIFVQIADTQLGFTHKNADMIPEINNFTKAVEHINRLHPAFVVISGDMINRPHDIAQIRAFWRIAGQIKPDIPLHLIPGNHDINPVTESNVRSYNKLFGEEYYSFTCQGSVFIALDSSAIHYPNSDVNIRNAQRKWFEEQLAAAKANGAKHIFVLTHHPWFHTSPNEADDYYNIPQAERSDYQALMKRYNVEYALAGHSHKEQLARDEGLTVITTATLSVNFDKKPAGFRVVRVKNERIEHAYYPLDNVPERIEP